MIKTPLGVDENHAAPLAMQKCRRGLGCEVHALRVPCCILSVAMDAYSVAMDAYSDPLRSVFIPPSRHEMWMFCRDIVGLIVGCFQGGFMDTLRLREVDSTWNSYLSDTFLSTKLRETEYFMSCMRQQVSSQRLLFKAMSRRLRSNEDVCSEFESYLIHRKNYVTIRRGLCTTLSKNGRNCRRRGVEITGMCKYHHTLLCKLTLTNRFIQ